MQAHAHTLKHLCSCPATIITQLTDKTTYIHTHTESLIYGNTHKSKSGILDQDTGILISRNIFATMLMLTSTAHIKIVFYQSDESKNKL